MLRIAAIVVLCNVFIDTTFLFASADIVSVYQTFHSFLEV